MVGRGTTRDGREVNDEGQQGGEQQGTAGILCIYYVLICVLKD
jgi:hypothetical protein